MDEDLLREMLRTWNKWGDRPRKAEKDASVLNWRRAFYNIEISRDYFGSCIQSDF